MLSTHGITETRGLRREIAPSLAERTRRTRHEVVARGILDSYRKEKGLPIPPADSSNTGSSSSMTSTITKQQPAAAKTSTKSWVEKILGKSEPADDVEVDEEDSPCPVECVLEVDTDTELQEIFDTAGASALVVVDFYKTACGACKYIMPGFIKLCQASASGRSADQPPVVFVKHNVYDDEEGSVTDLAKKHNIRSVPKFVFFRQGEPVESFATRDKEKVAAAILKHAEPGSVSFGDWA